MPYSIEFPLPPAGARRLPGNVVSALHANFFKWLELGDPPLARAMDAAEGVKPFTVSPLVMQREWASFRITLLADDLFEILRRGTTLRPEVNLLGEVFPVREEPEVVGATYAQLAHGADASAATILHFRTPASFRVNDMHHVFPDPELVFTSYAARWNAFAPPELIIAPAWLEWVRAAVAVSRFRLDSDVVYFGKYQQIGCVGRVQYRVSRPAPEHMANVLNCLADYAFYCGTGNKTTQGMGQTLRLPNWNDS
jgi:CRISPR-associated endoribonuclease Cas6